MFVHSDTAFWPVSPCKQSETGILLTERIPNRQSTVLYIDNGTYAYVLGLPLLLSTNEADAKRTVVHPGTGSGAAGEHVRQHDMVLVPADLDI